MRDPTTFLRWAPRVVGIVLAVFVAWSAWVGVDVHGLRTDVATRVGWLQELQEIQRDLATRPDAGASPAASLEALRSATPTEPEFEALRDHLAQSRNALLAGDRAAAATGLDAATREIRAQTGAISATLGSRFDALYGVILGSVLCAGALLLVSSLASRKSIEVGELGDKLRGELADHRATTDRLQRALRRYDTISRATEDGLWEWDPDTGRVEFAPRWFAMAGLESGATTLDTWLDRVHPDDRALVDAALTNARVDPGTPAAMEYRLQRSDGQWRDMVCRAIGTSAEDGSARVAGAQTDVTGRRVATAMEEQHRLLEHVTTAIGAGVLQLGADGSVQRSTSTTSRLARPWSSIGEWWSDLRAEVEEPARVPCPDCGALVPVGEARVDLRAPDHSIRVLLLTWTGHGHGLNPANPPTLVMVRDVTDRAQLEATLRLADRMASVGTLAAGLAHEINNPLAFVAGNLELLRGELPPGDSALRAERMAEGVARVSNIVAALRAFSRGGGTDLVPVDANGIVTAAAQLIAHQAAGRATLETRLDATLPALASPAWLGQVVLNLAVNAVQAIPTGSFAYNVVRMHTRDDGDDVLIEVSDSGTGIPPALRERIFDPFFTTKGVGEGTGLGLFISHDLVQRMNGQLRLTESSPDGSTFRIRLPRATMPAEILPPTEPDLAPRRGRVLAIDDERELTEIFTEFLAGHEVEAVHNGADAIAALDRAPWDVVLCDIMLPDMTGLDIHGWVLERRPELADRFIFVTGGALTTEVTQYLQSIANVRFLKPCDLRALAAAVDRQVATNFADAASPLN